MIYSTSLVAQTAILGNDVTIGNNVSIGAFAIVEDGVIVGDNCVIAAHAILKTGAVLEAGVQVDHFAVIAGMPQDLGFDPGIPSRVLVGAGTRLREGVTLHRSTKSGGTTIVGPNCYLMAGAHVAHDCVIGQNVIIAGSAAVAGHVHVGDYAFISGGVMVHQFVRVGESAMCSGNARLGMDIPPFVNALERNEVAGLNLVGMRRRGFSREEIADVKNAYQAAYGADTLNIVSAAAAAIEAGVAKTPKGRQFLQFFTSDETRRHAQFIRPRSGKGEE